jgi:hypothetical protein
MGLPNQVPAQRQKCSRHPTATCYGDCQEMRHPSSSLWRQSEGGISQHAASNKSRDGDTAVWRCTRQRHEAEPRPHTRSMHSSVPPPEECVCTGPAGPPPLHNRTSGHPAVRATRSRAPPPRLHACPAGEEGEKTLCPENPAPATLSATAAGGRTSECLMVRQKARRCLPSERSSTCTAAVACTAAMAVARAAPQAAANRGQQAAAHWRRPPARSSAAASGQPRGQMIPVQRAQPCFNQPSTTSPDHATTMLQPCHALETGTNSGAPGHRNKAAAGWHARQSVMGPSRCLSVTLSH